MVLAGLGCVLAVAGVFVLKGAGLLNPTPAAAAPPPPQNRYGAPVPTNPRDVRALEANVCAALDPAQWRALNIEPAGRPGRAMTGWPTCDWQSVPGPKLVRTLGPDLAESSEHVLTVCAQRDDPLRRARAIKALAAEDGMEILAGTWIETRQRAEALGFGVLGRAWLTVRPSTPSKDTKGGQTDKPDHLF